MKSWIGCEDDGLDNLFGDDMGGRPAAPVESWLAAGHPHDRTRSGPGAPPPAPPSVGLRYRPARVHGEIGAGPNVSANPHANPQADPHDDPHGDASGLGISFGTEFGAAEGVSGGDPVHTADRARITQSQKGPSAGGASTGAGSDVSWWQALTSSFFGD